MPQRPLLSLTREAKSWSVHGNVIYWIRKDQLVCPSKEVNEPRKPFNVVPWEKPEYWDGNNVDDDVMGKFYQITGKTMSRSCHICRVPDSGLVR